jgi:zinc protease
MKAAAIPFKELALLSNNNVTLSGIEKIQEADAYVIKSGKSTYYYDVKSGLKVAEAKEVEQRGQKMTQTSYFADYKDVKGVKIPFKTTLNIGIELVLTTSEVKINEGVSDEDFK